ncbi:MAG: hypothetical protein EBR59_10655 [Methylococcaceae bacterium]|nr:hypothetical protein [Methylococcaceae bacterium]
MAITSEQVNNGFEVSAADLLLGKLRFQPQANANGDQYSSFSFQVRDTGGTERGGVDLEPQPNTITFNVWPVNDSPTGKLEISGDPVAGQVLQISSTVQDADGFAKIQYQWFSDGDAITDATDDHFTLRAQDVGHVLSVVGRYTDFGGTPESVFSATKVLVLPKVTVTTLAGKTSVSGTRYADVFDCALYPGLKIMGGEGDDSYLINSSASKLIESAHSGVDSVYSSVSFTLPSNIENLFSDASSSVVLTGNSGQNLIRGGSGNDSLNGLSGNDTLVGGDGRDVFMFTTILNSRTNLDTILDFNPQEDVIGLKAALFRKLGAAVDADEADFLSNGTAKTSHSYLLYDPDTGYLSYDADANGPSLARPIAIIGQHLTLTPANFII